MAGDYREMRKPSTDASRRGSGSTWMKESSDQGESEAEEKDQEDEVHFDIPTEPRSTEKMSIKEITRELDKRNLGSTGFWEDDSRELQARFDLEFHETVKQVTAERDAYLAEKERKRILAIKLAEEKARMEREAEALAAHPQGAFWANMIGKPTCPKDLQLSNVAGPTLDVISRRLDSAAQLCSLDISQSMLDFSCISALSSALCQNNRIQRLELVDCNIQPAMVAKLSEVLITNSSIVNLSLENNPLTGDEQNDLTGVSTFCQSLDGNKSLIVLNLWRTGLGKAGGEILVAAVKKNTTLLSVGTGCSGLLMREEKELCKLLERNETIRLKAQKLQKHELERQKARQRDIEMREQRLRDQEAEDRWLEERKKERALAREQARLELIRLEEEERQRVEEEKAKAAEEERLALEARRKRAARRKKKKKK